MDYTAVGRTTHLAGRMEQMATPGTILLAPATLQLTEGYVEVTAREPAAVKGLPEPVEIYAHRTSEIDSAFTEMTREQAGAVVISITLCSPIIERESQARGAAPSTNGVRAE